MWLMHRKEDCPIYGNGKNIRDWLFVGDHVDGIERVIHKGISGNVYNFGGGNELTNIDLVKYILDLLNIDHKNIKFIDDRPGHDFRYSLSFEKSKRELGKLILTGDGEQTRNYTHVSDIVLGNLLAMFNDYCGVIDLCTGKSIPLNYAANFFDCPIEYIDERPGDVKHIIQSPEEAYNILGWKALTPLEEGIVDVL